MRRRTIVFHRSTSPYIALYRLKFLFMVPEQVLTICLS
jgi:hypothetical protein